MDVRRGRFLRETQGMTEVGSQSLLKVKFQILDISKLEEFLILLSRKGGVVSNLIGCFIVKSSGVECMHQLKHPKSGHSIPRLST